MTDLLEGSRLILADYSDVILLLVATVALGALIRWLRGRR